MIATISPEMHATNVRISCGDPSVVTRGTEIKLKKFNLCIFATAEFLDCKEILLRHINPLINFSNYSPFSSVRDSIGS